MSNFIMTQHAQRRAEVEVKKMIKEYNDPELTKKGKLEVLEMAFFMMFLEGTNYYERKRDD